MTEMTKQMDNAKHFTEEQLIEHYYGESPRPEHFERHLKSCGECGRNYVALQRDLQAVKIPATPVRGEHHGEEVWQSIRSSVAVYEGRRSRWLKWKPLAWAAVSALLLVTAFVAGGMWQRKSQNNIAAAHNAVDPQARQRVVVVVLGDHLDRSERLLVELNHASGKDAAEALPIQSEARELLAANRLVRQSAKQSGDPGMDAALDRLERLLIELANEPGGLDEADLNRLRQEMNTDGLLFDVRVLRSRVMEQQPNRAGSKGVSL